MFQNKTGFFLNCGPKRQNLSTFQLTLISKIWVNINLCIHVHSPKFWSSMAHIVQAAHISHCTLLCWDVTLHPIFGSSGWTTGRHHSVSWDTQPSRDSSSTEAEWEIKLTAVSSKGPRESTAWTVEPLGYWDLCLMPRYSNDSVKSSCYFWLKIYGFIFFSWQETYPKHHFPPENVNVFWVSFIFLFGAFFWREKID